MGISVFHLRVIELRMAFVYSSEQIQKGEQQAGGNIGQVYERIGTRSGATDRKKSKSKYLRSDTLKVKVYAYQNAEILNRVDITAPWYKEHKVVETGHYYVIVLTNGYRVRYKVQVYTFKGIPNNERKLNELFNYIRRNPKGDYSGWLHHANIYWQVTKLFKDQKTLNFFL